jgi:hypothetical protein
MGSLMQEQEAEKRINKLFLGALAIGLVVVLGAVAFMLMRPSSTQVAQQSLEGAFREGSPEFEAYTKKIVVLPNQGNTMISPTAMGTVVMSIPGVIRNIGDKTITGLEVKVTVIDLASAPVKEKTVIIVPKQQVRLEPNESINIRVSVEGIPKDANIANYRWKVTAIKLAENG